jgi:hypothetical protein
MGLERKPKMEKVPYISCLTAGSLIVRSINDKPLYTQRESSVGIVLFMHEINSPR